ncbi:MAG TPA: T9SS type A sorting domain-containing protein [Candidatus Marinimicrobia bacterium]|nr:T9SS type A sorting domain-containing protein [Candidatus Neomarinimicrobiota bacterium]
MRKQNYLFLVIFLFTTTFLNGNHRLYVQSTTQVGPGIVHKYIHAPTAPWIINVLEIDLKNPYVYLESVKAKNLLYGMERTSSMAQRSDAPNHRVIGAVNADFYDMSTGIPVGTQMVKGEILKTSAGWQAIGFNADHLPFINNVLFSGSLITATDNYSIHGINKSREENQLILYNQYLGSTTNTNIWGSEIVVRPITPWYANDTIVCVIDTLYINQGNSTIPKGQAVLSGHGNSATFLNTLSVKDTVKLYLGLTTPLQNITDVVGGNLKILSNGVYTGSTNTDLHPRTIAGFSADSCILYLATVDGRQSGSIGMNYRQLSDLMLFLGAHHAINLDGGGSTTMVIRNQIVNSLFADERSVANALMVISEAPDTGTLSSIQISPDNYRIFWGGSLKFNVSGWDEYFNPVSINPENLVFNCDENIGSINHEGNFLAADEVDSGYVYVYYGEMADSAYIYIKSAQRIEINPKKVVTDSIKKIQFTPTVYDIDNLTAGISRSAVTWILLNPEIGQLDSLGKFSGSSNGNSKIVAEYCGLTDTAEVIVEIGTGSTIIDSLNSPTGWVLTGENFNPSNTSISSVVMAGETLRALCLSYEFIRRSDARAWIYLNSNIPIYGLPDSIFLDIKSNPGDHKPHMVNLVIADDDNELYQKSSIFNDTTFTSYGFALSDFAQIEPASNFYFPISLKRIEIRLGYEGGVGDTNHGVIYLDNLKATYPVSTNIEREDRITLPGSFYLFQNYPNPFNATTTLRFRLPQKEHTTLSLYNLRGEKVKTIVSKNLTAGFYEFGVDGSDLASGIYLYRLESGSNCQTRKLILLK